jgi:hypothetical protein
LLGRRIELSGDQVRQLALRAVDAVRHHLMARAGPEARAHVETLLGDLSADIEWADGMERRDYSAARRAVDRMERDPMLVRTALASAANGRAYEMTLVLLAASARTETRAIDRVMAGRDTGGILLLCKAIELEWSTVRAILALHRCGKTASAADLDRCSGQFSRIDAALAERVVHFWQARGTVAGCAITPRDTFATPFRDGDNDWINWTMH